MAPTTAEDAQAWLRQAEVLTSGDESQQDPAELLQEEMALLQQIHSEFVDTEFLRHLWASAGWEKLRNLEAALRALAVEHSATAQWQRDAAPVGGSTASWELLRPPYVPELPREVAATFSTKLAGIKSGDVQASEEEKTNEAVDEAQRYVLEAQEEESTGASLWLDPGGNLETVMPAKAAEPAGALTVPGTAMGTWKANWQCREALCAVSCRKALCEHPQSLCWHCWRREETGEQHPEELNDLLAYARRVAETAAPLQRAAEVAWRWSFLEDIATATVDRLRALSVDTASAPSALVLGGVGVSAIRAAQECKARVWIWEPRRFMAASIRAILGANDLGCGSVTLIEGDTGALEAAIAGEWSNLALIVVEGLEMDGLLGFGAIKQLRAAQEVWRREAGGATGTNSVQVLPSTLSVRVRLADARVAEVSGFDFSPFARVSKAFAPFLSAKAESATSTKPRPLTEELEAFSIDLADMEAYQGEASWDFPDRGIEERSLRFAKLSDNTENAAASAVLVSFKGAVGAGDFHDWGESIFYIPPVSAPAQGPVLRCFRNSAKIWFEASLESESETAKSGPEATLVSSPMPLHGPPFGHAFLQEWYLDMYRDTDRNDFYEEGLRRWVNKQRRERASKSESADSEDCSGDRVMDIGSGTGLLLFFALRAGATCSVGVEVAPNLARMSEALFEANASSGRLSKDAGFKVIRNDALRLALPEAERPHCLVTEMMDGSGFGENMVHVILHAKRSLLAAGAESQIIPRRMKLKSVLLDIHLPCIAGVNLAPLEAFWGPTRAMAVDGDFANVDLDSREAGSFSVCSEVVEVWDVDFARSQDEIRDSLRAHTVEFPLVSNDSAEIPSRSLNANAVAWWFEAFLDEDGESEPAKPLTNVPVFLREGDWGGGTHWAQAVAATGPQQGLPGGCLKLNVRTDGKKITWAGASDAQEDDAEATAQRPVDMLREEWLEAARQAEEQAQRTLWQRQRMAADVGDTSRVAALQAAAMHVSSQPGLFGVFGGASVASHILKEFFGAGCSAGF